MKQLLTFDFPSIHSYVFATNKLVELRGASNLLHHLNAKVVPRSLTKELGGECVYAHGGNGLLVVDADDDAIEAAVRRAQGDVSRKSGGGLQLTAGWAPFPSADAFSESLRQAVRHRTRNRFRGPEHILPELLPHVRRCSSCGREAAVETVEDPDDPEPEALGRACIAKRQQGRPGPKGGVQTAWERALEGLDTGGVRAEDLRARQLKDIGEACQTSRKAIAVVYADGDRMGQLVQRIESQEVYQDFARAVDEAVCRAAGDAMMRTIGRGGRIAAEQADVILLGGDDVVAVLPADLGLRFAVELSKSFHERVQQTFEGKGPLSAMKPAPTVSAGVAIGPPDQPFWNLVEKAEELLESAKTATKPGHGGIDFADVSQTRTVPIADLRQNELTERRCDESGRQVKLKGYGRPYPVDVADRVLCAAEMLADRVGSTRLQSMVRASDQDPLLARFEMARLLARLADGKGEFDAIRQSMQSIGAWEGFGWVKLDEEDGSEEWHNRLLDLGELMPFVASARG